MLPPRLECVSVVRSRAFESCNTCELRCGCVHRLLNDADRARHAAPISASARVDVGALDAFGAAATRILLVEVMAEKGPRDRTGMIRDAHHVTTTITRWAAAAGQAECPVCGLRPVLPGGRLPLFA